MRTITVTEKYKAVNEGRMAKSEFVRQMRQEYPMYISNFDGFDSTVSILKNKQMLFEAKKSEAKAPIYDVKPSLTYSLDALDRGIRIELQLIGIDMAAQTVKPEDYKQAEKKAKDNLQKNATHYLDLMSGESDKVDKHDREKEVKRGSKDTDVFNGMKKATLKEEVVKEEEVVDPTPQMSEDAKKALLGKVVGALRTDYPDVTASIIKDFIKMHGQDLLDGADIQTEFEAYIAANYQYYTRGIETDPVDLHKMVPGIGPDDYESMEEKKGKDHDGDGDVDGDDYMAAKDKAIKKAMGKDVDEDQEGDHNFYDNKEKAQQIMQIAKDAINLMDEQPGTSVKDAIEAVIEDMDESYAMKRMQKAHDQDRRAGKKSTYDIAREKQAEKEKQLKEAIKSIIKKSLNEDVINEAATNRLASLQDDFGDYSGASQIINQLENIVTEVEQFHTKTREKIQKVYDSMESIENGEGLKIGVFIGPSIENAFKQDLRPVIKHGYTKDLTLPKAKRLDPNLVAQARAQGDIEEIGDAKHTVFSPNI